MAAGRPKNSVDTETITLSASPQVRHCLNQLALKGIFGKTPAEVAHQIICREIKQLVNEGTFLTPADLEGITKKTNVPQ